MSTASLRERMKQLQELKSSIQMKSQAALAREKEIADAAEAAAKAEEAKLEEARLEEAKLEEAKQEEAKEDQVTKDLATEEGQSVQAEDQPSPTEDASVALADPTDSETIADATIEREPLTDEPSVPVTLETSPGEADEEKTNEEIVETPDMQATQDIEDTEDDIEVIVEEVEVEGSTTGVEIVETEELVVVADYNQYEHTIETEATDGARIDPEEDLEAGVPGESGESLPPASEDVSDASNIEQSDGSTDDEEGQVAWNPKAGLPKDEGGFKRFFLFLLVVVICGTVVGLLYFWEDIESRRQDKDLPAVTEAPTISSAPTIEPSSAPSVAPTASAAPSVSPTMGPSGIPTASAVPSDTPTLKPTIPPTLKPTKSPTKSPITPTKRPSTAPVPSPTKRPLSPTTAPVPGPSGSPTTQRLDNFIKVFCIPISGEEVFQDQSTPQFQAAKFMAGDDEYAPDVTDETTLSERYAMVTFYFATIGSDWKRCSSDDSSCAKPWLVGDVCNWAAVTCNSAGRIVSIVFDGVLTVGLSGFIPPEIYVLQFLEDFTIIDEDVGGSLPERFGTDATSIRKMTVQGTQLKGPIPFGYLENSPIESLSLNSNRIGGTIPFEIGSIATLTELDLSGNRLTGTLPGGLTRYSSLTTLAVDSNRLEGSIPTAIYAMTKLQRLHVNDNVLMDGFLDPEIGFMAALQGLRAGNTSIGGTLPTDLFGLGNLVELDLRDAKFEGTIPSAFSILGATLQELQLQNNAFTGTVPSALGALTSLTVLTLQGNDLVGSIASGICALVGGALEELSVDCDEVLCSCCTQCFR